MAHSACVLRGCELWLENYTKIKDFGNLANEYANNNDDDYHHYYQDHLCRTF